MAMTNELHLQVKHLIPATPIKIKNYLSSMRADLSRMIKNWELSGQGDGSLTNEAVVDDTSEDGSSTTSHVTPTTGKPSFGALDNRTNAAMDCRASFLGGKPSYLLMFWELADKYQLLASTLQRLDRAAVAGGDEVQPVYKIARPSPVESDNTADNNLSTFTAQFQAHTAVQNAVNRRSDLLDQIRSYRVNLRRCPADEKEFWVEEIRALEKEVEENDAVRRRIERKINHKLY
jgi:hypothetical protein